MTKTYYIGLDVHKEVMLIAWESEAFSDYSHRPHR